MYCSKCGKKISSSDQFCPACGAKNINYKAPKNVISVQTGGKSVSSNTKKKIRIIIPVVAAVCVIGLFSSIILVRSKRSVVKKLPKNPISNRHYYAMENEDGDQYFYIDGNTIKFDGKYDSGVTTPDCNQFILDGEDQFTYYSSKDAKPVEVSMKDGWVSEELDTGCFYRTQRGDDYETHFYSYETGENIDLGCTASFSENGKVAAGINSNGELVEYQVGDKEPKVLGTANKDATICGISNDGSFVIWYTEDDGVSVFMMVNGVPERIGKLGKVAAYGYAYCYFFNNDRQFIVSYSDNNTMLYYNGSKDIETLALAENEEFVSVLDQNGDEIGSDEANVTELYIIGQDSNQASIYRMQLDGTLETIVTDVGKDEYTAFRPTIKDNTLIYVDVNKDLCKKKLDVPDDGTVVTLTTEVTRIYPTFSDNYVYIVKAGALYYLDLNDKDAKLETITTKLGDEYSVYPTVEDNTVFYIQDEKEIPDSYCSTRGTLFQYTVGSKPVEIAKDVMEVRSNPVLSDSDYITTTPIVGIYKSKHEDDDGYDVYVGESGIIENSKYKTIVKDASL